ncbi:metallo-beta-lactamase superfamily protein [Proteus mirabilis]|uniref:Metallo-beta-lactamase superfamily protein n=1 Tax=Proteus mirabilis TaxID=584 RepID=A0A379GGQ0_PROMI|nr:metallo-beta-lactamase superfamily protein [Proteus mirabilis]
MAIDLTSLTTIVISHGHYDHFGGLTHLNEDFFITKPHIIAILIYFQYVIQHFLWGASLLNLSALLHFLTDSG